MGALGFQIVLVEVVGAARQRTVRVFLDREGGITLDDCARLTPIVSAALDAAEAADPGGLLAAQLSGSYTLEVSSPGIDRPLGKLHDFTRFVGRAVTIQTYEPIPGPAGPRQRTFHGTILAASPPSGAGEPGVEPDPYAGTVTIRAKDPLVAGQPPPELTFDLGQIRRAQLNHQG